MNQFRTVPLIPRIYSSLASKKVWFTVSNAADRSGRTKITFLPLSRDNLMSFCTISVLLRVLYADCGGSVMC